MRKKAAAGALDSGIRSSVLVRQCAFALAVRTVPECWPNSVATAAGTSNAE